MFAARYLCQSLPRDVFHNTPITSRHLAAYNSKRPPKRLVPWLRRSDTTHNILAITHIEVKLREELLLRQWIGRIDAEIAIRPRRMYTRMAQHLDSPSHTQSIRDTCLDLRRKIEISLALQLIPQRIAKRSARNLTRPRPCSKIISASKARTSRTLGQMVPAQHPWAFECRIAIIPH